MAKKTVSRQISDHNLTKSIVKRIAPAIAKHIRDKREEGKKKYGVNTFAKEIGLSDRKALANMLERGSVSLSTLIRMCAISEHIRKETVSFFLYSDEETVKQITQSPDMDTSMTQIKIMYQINKELKCKNKNTRKEDNP